MSCNSHSAEYKQLQMRLAEVRAKLKHVVFLSNAWQELDAEETKIISMMED